MEVLLTTLLFLFGITIGSFLNVVIYRSEQGRSIIGRSACMVCQRVLGALELVPVFSFVWLQGRCRTCRTPLPWQYPAVELLTAFMFVEVATKFGFSIVSTSVLLWGVVLLHLVIWCLLIVIAFHDLNTTIIPDTFVYSAAALALISQSLTSGGFVMPTLLGFLAGPLVAAPLFFLWLISRGRWIGLADSKLALVFGWLLSLTGGYTAVIFAFWIGAFVGVLLIGLKHLAVIQTKFPSLKKVSIKSEIPFGPFLVLGCALVYFLGFDLFSVIL